MAIQKDKIIVGNTFSVQYVSTLPSEGSYIETPLNPLSAYVELWDVAAQQFVSLGSAGPDARGAAATVSTNVITYTLPTSKTQTAGDYKLYTTAVYSDGQTVTELRAFKVSAKS